MVFCRSNHRRRIIIAKKKTTFVCQNCEYHSPKYLGRCPNCGAWSSFVEEVETAEEMRSRFIAAMAKYRNYQTVLVVAHRMLIRQFVPDEQIDFCQCIECELEI